MKKLEEENDDASAGMCQPSRLFEEEKGTSFDVLSSIYQFTS